MNKQTPAIREYEQGLLASMCLFKEQAEYILSELNEDDFYYYDEEFKHAKKQFDENGLVDAILIEQSTGYQPTVYSDRIGNTEHQCKVVKEKAAKRKMIPKLQRAMNECYEPDSNLFTIRDEVAGIAVGLDKGASSTASMRVPDYLEYHANKPVKRKLLTGQYKIDEGVYEHSGLRIGDYHCIMADSGHGKTQYAMMLTRLLLNAGHKGMWVNLEDHAIDLAKYFGAECGKNSSNLWLLEKKFNLEDIKKEIRIVNKSHNLDFIVIDYIQKVENHERMKTPRVEHTSDSLAKFLLEQDLNGQILSQVTINQDQYRNGWNLEPRQNDTRDSKQIKQDAMAMTAVFRPSKVEDLVLENAGEVWSKDYNGDPQPYNSVYARQVKIRSGQQKHMRLHLIHHESKGLQFYSPIEEHELLRN